MKKLITLIFIISFFSFFTVSKAKAQGHELKYNRVLIVGGSEQTVPPDAVWKVTSIYGEEKDVCLSLDCWSPGDNLFGKGFASCLYVNSVMIASTIRGFKSSNATRYTNNTCTAGAYTGSSYDFSCVNKTADPNILPIWLPAGTKLKSGGPNTFVSVMEFLEQ